MSSPEPAAISELGLDRPETTADKAKALVAAIPDLIFRIGVDGRYRGFKAESTRELATDPDSVIGSHVDERLPPEVAHRILANGRTAVADGAVRQVEYDLPIGEDVRHYEGRVAACGHDEFLLIVRDFTERRRQERELERLTSELRARVEELERERDYTYRVVAATPSFLALVDEDGTLYGVNRALERAGGFPQSEWLDRPFWTVFLAPEDSGRAREDFARLRRGETAGAVEYEHIGAGGERLVVDWTATEVIDGAGNRRYLLCGVDVTAHKRAQEEIRLSRARIVSATDIERKRLERNLHDGAQQHLVAVTHMLHLARRLLHQDPRAAEAHLDRALADVTAAHDELRELARGLHPVLLSQGLTAAVKALGRRTAIPVTLVTAGDVETAPQSVASVAFYVVAESLTNVAKYARATSARVRIVRETRCLVVEVVDDGIGGARIGAGSGLTGLADRVAALDGDLVVSSERGSGTTIRAELPL